MPRFIPGDYVRPISPNTGLPRVSVWAVHRYRNRADGAMELYSIGPTGVGSYPPSHVLGRVFYDLDFEQVVMVDGQWKAVNPPTALIDQAELGEPMQNIQETDPVKSADKLVEQAAAALDAAKENARKAREEARAAAKAEAKHKAAAAAAKKAREEREAISIRLHKDRDLAAATSDLLAEISRLHNGGPEKCAAARIALHVDQLQPLAKSYGYRIAKPGVIASVVKA